MSALRRPPDHALLIGISHYLPSRAQGRPEYRSLQGSVCDTENMSTFLMDRLGMPEQRIRRLISPFPPSSPESAPTYENLAAAFHRLWKSARPGERILVYYSGHGARVESHYRELKGSYPYDEALVPMDIGLPGGRYFRDVEMAFFLDQMVRKGLFVTLVLDSCHSGSAHRRPDPPPGFVSRGTGRVDRSAVDRGVLDHRIWDLRRAWWNRRRLRHRGRRLAEGWLPDPRGYVLLAACEADELAIEGSVGGGPVEGLFTHHLLKSFESVDPEATYEQVFRRTVSLLDTYRGIQTPRLEGESQWKVFAPPEETGPGPRLAISVTDVDSATGDVLMSSGQSQGVARGARLAIHPFGASDFDDPEDRVAVVEVQEYGSSEIRATVVKSFDRGEIERGAPAVLMLAGELVRRVDLEPLRRLHPELADATLAQLARLGGFLLEEGPSHCELRVAPIHGGRLEIRDADGFPLPHQKPYLRVGTGDRKVVGLASQLVERLSHIAHFHNVTAHCHPDPDSPLAGCLSVCPALAGSPVEIQAGGPLVVRVRNTAAQRLRLAVLTLYADWEIQQCFPRSYRLGDQVILESGETQTVEVPTRLPEGAPSARQLIKLYATIDPTSYRWMERRALGLPAVTRSSHEESCWEEEDAARDWTLVQLDVRLVHPTKRLRRS